MKKFLMSFALFIPMGYAVSFSNEEEVKSKEMAMYLVKEDSISVSVDDIEVPTLDINQLNLQLEELEKSVEVINENCIATYYHDKFNGRKTASGKVFSNNELTAAHKTLPFGTKLRVTNIDNDESVIVTVTDRGPFVKGKTLDLSKKAFMEITTHKGRGNLNVKIEKLPNDFEENFDQLTEEIEVYNSLLKSKNSTVNAV